MSLVAVGFAVMPLVRSQEYRNRGSANLSLLGVIVVFGIGIVLYGVIGRPDVKSHVPAPSTAGDSNGNAQQPATGEKVGSVASLLTGLEQRLADNPADGKGWLLLAQSYEVLGRLDDAAAAYDKATALGMSNDELAARLADASGGQGHTVEIRGRVGADPAVRDLIEPDAVVYIIARAGDNPMPLAVLRRAAGELPFDFVLSDANTMVQGAGLSTARDLTISVKVSNSGDALAAEETFETSIHNVDPNSGKPLEFTITKTGAQ